MKYAIVESGGKQYKAVEGETIEVDRLPVNAGDNVGLERVLLVVDGDNVTVGTPTVDIKVSATVVNHFKGPKILVFKYSPRKRIRVKSGHRQQYTRLMVDAIGAGSKATKATKTEAHAEEKVEVKAEKKEAAAAKPAAKKAPAKKTEKAATKKAPAKKAPAKKAEKAPAKKTTAKKTTTKKTSSTKKTEK